MTLFSPKTFSRTPISAALILIVFLSGCTQKSANLQPENKNPNTRKDLIDINTADRKELSRLPGIGPKTAEKILKHREEFGRFRRPAELILVEGFGEKQYLKIRNFIKTE